MTYGTKTVIPVEVGLPTSWTAYFEEEENNHLLGRWLDLIEENRKVSLVKLTNYQQRVINGYNKGVWSVGISFQETWC